MADGVAVGVEVNDAISVKPKLKPVQSPGIFNCIYLQLFLITYVLINQKLGTRNLLFRI